MDFYVRRGLNITSGDELLDREGKYVFLAGWVTIKETTMLDTYREKDYFRTASLNSTKKLENRRMHLFVYM